MKILILGSEGFIGSHLLQYFSEQGFEVVGCDIFEVAQSRVYSYHKISRLSPELNGILAKMNFDFCLNAAGSGNVPYSLEHPMIDFEANTIDTAMFLDSLKRFQPECRYIHISSAAVYGNPQQLPVIETHPLNPISPYGYHKWMSEIVCQEYYKIYNTPIAIIRPFSIYGAGQKKLLLWDICNKLKNFSNIQLYGNGNESRDYIHILDFARLVDCIIKKDHFKCEIFNAGTGKGTTIKEITDIITKQYNRRISISFSGEIRQGDPLYWKSDIKKAESIGFSPSIDLTNGVCEYINWFESIN